MIQKVLSKSGIKIGNEKALKISAENMLETMTPKDLQENFNLASETNINGDNKPINNEKLGAIPVCKIEKNSTIDLEKIKQRTKLLRADVDILLETLQV